MGIKEDRTLAAPTDDITLGPSSVCLPFAGYNDPRRLLMAANMQVQAVDVEGKQAPVVTTAGDGLDPPGVNLRVGYLAWGGWNHEDAWVVSESAAARLAAIETSTIYLERRALELDEPLPVQVGQHVRRGKSLITRRYAPALLTDDVAVLTALPTLDEAVTVEPEVGDLAPVGGKVTAIESWDLLAPTSFPPGWIPADGLTAHCRKLFRVTLRRRLPLGVGDKLANRHGHKGVVGLVLPDAEMPMWRGEPLEALIDPVSVLNRSNWGQLQEAVKAGPDPERDAEGRSPIALPAGRIVRAVAGVQFAMRLPQHATDKIAGSPIRDPAGELRSRAQRFGEMDDWAAWGHGLVAAGGERFTGAARRLADLLGGAGYRLALADAHATLASLPLAEEPPADFERVPLPGTGTLAEQYAMLDEDGGLRALAFEPEIVLPTDENKPDELPVSVRWLPLIPARARPLQRSADGTEDLHELTVLLRSLVRAQRRREDDPDAAGYALRRLMGEAYSVAVGRTATGTDSSKGAWLRQGVLGRQTVPSARAVISPSAGLGLALDEVGLPPVLVHTLFGPGLPAETPALAERVNGRTVWLKRDPVLHRWGLLPVRVNVVAGETIRLPASLLGPLGADYDGDTVAVFASLRGGREPTDHSRPPVIAWDGDSKTGRAMFFPTKQYLYGLHRMRRNLKSREALNRELCEAGGPEWPIAKTAKDELQAWVRLAAAQPRPDGAWWAVVERHALAALAEDPGMGLGLLPLDSIRALDVLVSGAVKNLYGEGPAGNRMAELLCGNGLKPYTNVTEDGLDSINDPIAGVMAAAKVAVGRFGGALRRLLYSLPRLTPELVRAAQTLTEQITQKALSVKAGEPPVSVGEFEKELGRLLKGEEPPEPPKPPKDGEKPEQVTPLLSLLVEPRMRGVWKELRAELGRKVPVWLRWLRSPHELNDLLAPGTELTLPLADPRTGPLVE